MAQELSRPQADPQPSNQAQDHDLPQGGRAVDEQANQDKLEFLVLAAKIEKLIQKLTESIDDTVGQMGQRTCRNVSGRRGRTRTAP